MLPREDQLHLRVLGQVRVRENLFAIDREQLGRRCAVAAQLRVADRETQIEHRVFRPSPTQHAEVANRFRLGIIAPSVFLEVIDVRVIAERLAMPAVLQRADGATERSAVHLRGRALIVEAVLHLERKRAAERVQAEHGIRSAEHLHAANRRDRNQIPVDRIAKRLVDAHTVLINGESLRQAEQRRDREAAEVHVRLQWIILGVVDVHARERSVQQLRHIGRLESLDVRVGDELHARRNVIEIDANTVRRRHDDFGHGRASPGLCSRCHGARRCQDARDRPSKLVARPHIHRLRSLLYPQLRCTLHVLCLGKLHAGAKVAQGNLS